ncbi:hypothetical protein D3C74_489750 [compost metagenome]
MQDLLVHREQQVSRVLPAQRVRQALRVVQQERQVQRGILELLVQQVLQEQQVILV